LLDTFPEGGTRWFPSKKSLKAIRQKIREKTGNKALSIITPMESHEGDRDHPQRMVQLLQAQQVETERVCGQVQESGTAWIKAALTASTEHIQTL
jgi:hypothetical protein